MKWVYLVHTKLEAASRRFALVLAAAVICFSLSGCIRVSPYFEIIDCAGRFVSAATAGDLSAVNELTVGRPDGWERALEAVAGALCEAKVVGAERSGDRAQARVQLQPSPGRAGEQVDLTESGRHGDAAWSIELVRVEGVWLVDLGKTLAPE